jgi:hypothetical protein
LSKDAILKSSIISNHKFNLLKRRHVNKTQYVQIALTRISFPKTVTRHEKRSTLTKQTRRILLQLELARNIISSSAKHAKPLVCATQTTLIFIKQSQPQNHTLDRTESALMLRTGRRSCLAVMELPKVTLVPALPQDTAAQVRSVAAAGR